MKQVAIIQSSYIPWKGYFDVMGHVDEFILYDDVQFTRRDWRTRNRIKTKDGLKWLSVPVRAKGHRDLAIKDVELVPGWQRGHWESIRHAYARAPHFKTYAADVEALYLGVEHHSLTESNAHFLRGAMRMLDIQTPVSMSMQYAAAGEPSERLAQICEAAGATDYVSGPAARSYLEPACFERRGIGVHFVNYEDAYEPYEQLHPPFDHAVSVLDVLFNTGPDARRFCGLERPAPWP